RCRGVVVLPWRLCPQGGAREQRHRALNGGNELRSRQLVHIARPTVGVDDIGVIGRCERNHDAAERGCRHHGVRKPASQGAVTERRDGILEVGIRHRCGEMAELAQRERPSRGRRHQFDHRASMLARHAEHEVGVADELLVELTGDVSCGIRGPESRRERLRFGRHALADECDRAGTSDRDAIDARETGPEQLLGHRGSADVA
ncbi:MAG TPA: hypothetical protein VFR16_04765, partial [Agromyces mariniharenae]|nr:hypothetical protein [Agromyces mariniharenae]